MVSKWPAAILKMRVHGLICAGVRSVHLAPPSVVTCSRPSPVPAHRTLTSRGEGPSAVTDRVADTVTVEAYLPAFCGTSHFWARVRSPLMAVQLWPPLVVFQTPAVAKNRTFGS